MRVEKGEVGRSEVGARLFNTESPKDTEKKKMQMRS